MMITRLPSHPASPLRWLFPLTALAALASIALWMAAAPGDSGASSLHNPSIACDQTGPLVPSADPRLNLSRFDAPLFRDAALKHFSKAITFRTESFDSQRNVAPPPAPLPDPIHEPFLAMHTFLQEAFPLVHSHLNRTIINRYSLLFHWRGVQSDQLPPLLLMAHLDVVPVLNDTLKQWIHAPFDGFVDVEGGKVWGRGASDTKQTVCAILEAVEALLKAGYINPSGGDVYVAFGHDEEISGHQGAKQVAKYMREDLDLAGKVGMIIDEGAGVSEFENITIAKVQVAEKGYVDVEIIVAAEGGHSSVPPKHTAIGFASLLVEAIESNPHSLVLSNNNPLLKMVSCLSRHVPRADHFYARALAHLDNPRMRERLLQRLAGQSPAMKARFSTTQAVDIVQGGLKVNALPERVSVKINHRIGVHDSVLGVQEHFERVLTPVVKRVGVNLRVMQFKDPSELAFQLLVSGARVNATVTTGPFPLEPSPVSPSNNREDGIWRVLEGTIHHVLDGRAWEGEGRVLVVPHLATGNTDTKHFWALTDRIFRFGPFVGLGAHTVNEYAAIDKFFDGVKFFHELIRNWGEMDKSNRRN
ncbi:hypothetical protein BC830DRAFT_1104026 [Chytriomyces sp. MP71]|nr:hypothetical protein BC830DRAFT_1104026 [Chytriomyces sp. MP71]